MECCDPHLANYNWTAWYYKHLGFHKQLSFASIFVKYTTYWCMHFDMEHNGPGRQETDSVPDLYRTIVSTTKRLMNRQTLIYYMFTYIYTVHWTVYQTSVWIVYLLWPLFIYSLKFKPFFLCFFLFYVWVVNAMACVVFSCVFLFFSIFVWISTNC